MLDNFERNHNLGLLYEVKYGAGKMLVCHADLMTLKEDYPEADCLLSGLTNKSTDSPFLQAFKPSALSFVIHTALSFWTKIFWNNALYALRFVLTSENAAAVENEYDIFLYEEKTLRSGVILNEEISLNEALNKEF